MNVQRALKLDKRLKFKSSIDGSKLIYRNSPFNATRDFTILDLRNQFLGSGRWLRDTLIKMDTQRQDIVARVLANNYALRKKGTDNRAHREVADMFESGGDTFVN